MEEILHPVKQIGCCFMFPALHAACRCVLQGNLHTAEINICGNKFSAIYAEGM